MLTQGNIRRRLLDSGDTALCLVRLKKGYYTRYMLRSGSICLLDTHLTAEAEGVIISYLTYELLQHVKFHVVPQLCARVA